MHLLLQLGFQDWLRLLLRSSTRRQKGQLTGHLQILLTVIPTTGTLAEQIS